MELVTAEAIVLDTYDLHEYDRIVTLLTRERGKVRGVARGARRKYSRFAGQLQPLAKARVTWFHRDGRDLVRISAVELERPAHRLYQDLEGILVGSCLAEHMVEFAQENEPADRFFRLLDATVEALIDGADRNLAMRYFEAWVLRLGGVFPAPRECPSCGGAYGGGGARLDSRGESLMCKGCSAAGNGGLDVSAAALEFLRRIGRESLADLRPAEPSPDLLAEVERVAGRVRRGFLHHELKSYGVMRDILAEGAP